MTPEEYQKVAEICREAVQLKPEERAAFLAETCRDNRALQQEVESLLAYRDEDDAFIDRPALQVVAERLASEQRSWIGQEINNYRIVSLIGRGGMGEVYRARDKRLGRDVAIKVLPPAFTSDSERRARFEREARALAALNHPNIATIHGVEETADTTALVMELVEGETLAERLERRQRRSVGLNMQDALSIARQIAEAVEAAHERGIVHRDLKPANIKVRPDGAVKVLDFGLAKAFTSAGDRHTSMGGEATEAGVIMGTPAYMSPEHARGEAANRQADIWSFGVVLYELLTGLSPFARPTSADTLASVLADSPDYSRLPAETPPSARRLIRRCLEKEAKHRLHHIGDARIELQEALTPSAPDPLSTSAHAAATVAQSARNIRRASALAVAALVLGIVAGAFWMSRRAAPPSIVRTFVDANILLAGSDRSFAFTADGNGLVYMSSDGREMFVRSLDSLEPVAILTTAAFIKGPFPSPDGRWFGYIEDNFTLKKISAAGGPPPTVLRMDGPSRGAAWGQDDTIVFSTGASDTGLQRVAASGGPVTVLTRPDRERGESDHMQPVWLPGGRSLLFTIIPTQGGLDAAKTAVLDLATGVWRTIIEGGYAARYASSGHLVYGAAGALWAIRFDLRRLETSGAPREVLRPLSTGTTGAVAEFDIAGNGTLVYSRGVVPSERRVPVWVDRNGRETTINAPTDNYTHPRLSPDGQRLAIVVRGDIYLWDLTRPWSTESRVTFSPFLDWFPVWMPDSRRIVFGSWRGGGFSNLYTQDPGTGSTERLTDSADMQLPTAMTPDGSTIFFHSFTRSLQALRMQAGAELVTLVETPVEERNAALSPDGRWLAYEGESMSRPGELDVYVRPFPDVDRGLWQVTSGGGTFPVWARNGRELFFVTPDGTIAGLPVEASNTTWKAGSPKQLFRGQYHFREGSLGRLYDVAPDGRFLVLKHETTTDSERVILVQNWMAELVRLLP